MQKRSNDNDIRKPLISSILRRAFSPPAYGGHINHVLIGQEITVDFHLKILHRIQNYVDRLKLDSYLVFVLCSSHMIA